MNNTKKKNLPVIGTALKKNSYYLILLAALALIFVIMSVVNENYVRVSNLVNMLEQMAEYSLMALGIMLCFVGGGVDLSTVGVANMVGALGAMALVRYVPADCSDTTFLIGIVMVILGGIVIGLVAGLLNGVLIAKIGIPPMLATMSTNYVYTGISMVLTKGASISDINPRFVTMMNYKFFDFLPLSIVILLICTVLIGILMNKATFGTKLCMIGTNPKATRMSGLKNDRVLITIHVIPLYWLQWQA